MSGGPSEVWRALELEPDDPTDQALAALEEDLGVRINPSTGPPRPTRTSHVKWDAVYEWCKRHPGFGWEVVGIHANAGYRLRQRYGNDPGFRVVTRNVRVDPDSGRRINDMYCIYERPYDDDVAGA